MPPVYGVLLTAKGETKKIKLKDSKETEPLTLDHIQKLVKKKTEISILGSYPYEKLTLTLFGYDEGKAGTENKHDLPPPLDQTLYFGDIVLIASKDAWSAPVNFGPDEYEKFYQKAFGGFEDLDEEDDEDEEEEDEVEEVEEEETEEEIAAKKKKKAAEEEGVPEDEEEDEEDEVEEEDEEDEVEADEEEVDDDEGTIVAKKAAPKKKAAKTVAANQQTGRAKQQALLRKTTLVELDQVVPLASASGQEAFARQQTLALLTKFLGPSCTKKFLAELEQAILTIAFKESTQRQVFKHFENSLFQSLYQMVVRRIVSNLDPKSYVQNASTLLQKLIKKDITMSTFTTLNVMDYSPTLYANLREQQQLREQRQLEGNRAMVTDMFKCGRCHKRECTFYEMQTRSADEPMTKFINCINCGNHWRQ